VAKAAAGPTRRGRIGRGAIIWRCRESRRVACAAVGRDRVKNWGVLFGAFHAISVGFSVQVGQRPGFTGASRSFSTTSDGSETVSLASDSFPIRIE
jgi:hypothetical protein